MPRRPANHLPTASTLSRLQEALLLVALAALVSRVLWAVVSAGWAEQLAKLFGRHLSLRYPVGVATAVLFLAAFASVSFYRLRRRRLAKRRPVSEAISPGAPTESFEMLAYALFGLLYVTLLSPGRFDILSPCATAQT